MKFGSRRLGGLLLAGLHGTTHDYGSRSQATHLCFWQRLPPVGAWCPLLVDFGLPELLTQLLASLHVSRIIQFAFLVKFSSHRLGSLLLAGLHGATHGSYSRSQATHLCFWQRLPPVGAGAKSEPSGTKPRTKYLFDPLLSETSTFVAHTNWNQGGTKWNQARHQAFFPTTPWAKPQLLWLTQVGTK